MLATFLHMLQGTPYVYQGEEIGMTNVKFESIADYRDIETVNMHKEYVGGRRNGSPAVLPMIYAKSRDNARTPVQWDDSEHAGFTTGTLDKGESQLQGMRVTKAIYAGRDWIWQFVRDGKSKRSKQKATAALWRGGEGTNHRVV